MSARVKHKFLFTCSLDVANRGYTVSNNLKPRITPLEARALEKRGESWTAGSCKNV
jgi:hypothetical protein